MKHRIYMLMAIAAAGIISASVAFGQQNPNWDSRFQGRDINARYIKSSAGLYQKTWQYDNIPVKSTWAYLSEFGLSSATLLARSTTVVAGAPAGGSVFKNVTSSMVARNITIMTTTTIISGWVKVTGKDQFNRTNTETVYMVNTTTASGSIAWMTVSQLEIRITSMTVPITAGVVNILFWFGTGNVLGLDSDILASSDIYYAEENGSPIKTSDLVIDVSNDTVIFKTAPNGTNDYRLKLFAAGSGTYRR
jgi:hypothetical protein